MREHLRTILFNNSLDDAALDFLSQRPQRRHAHKGAPVFLAEWRDSRFRTIADYLLHDRASRGAADSRTQI